MLIHIGYHKTATTWLQQVLFQPEHGFRWLLSHREVFDHLVMPHGLHFDPDATAALIAARRREVENLGTQSGGTDNGPAGNGPAATGVITLEALVGNPFHGGRESDAYAHRLRAVAPDARILITIREQCRMMASVYMQYLKRAGTLPPRAFFAGEPVGGYFGFDAAHFEYDRLVALYQALFGAENVLVLPLEAILHDQGAAVGRIARFAGNTALEGWTHRPAQGVSTPEAAAPLLRRLNHLRCGPAHREPLLDLGAAAEFAHRAAGALTRRLKPTARPVTATAREIFAGRFAESNRRLAARAVPPEVLAGYQGIDSPHPPDGPARQPIGQATGQPAQPGRDAPILPPGPPPIPPRDRP